MVCSVVDLRRLDDLDQTTHPTAGEAHPLTVVRRAVDRHRFGGLHCDRDEAVAVALCRGGGHVALDPGRQHLLGGERPAVRRVELHACGQRLRSEQSWVDTRGPDIGHLELRTEARPHVLHAGDVGIRQIG